MISKFTKVGFFLTSTSLLFMANNQQPIKCESKRSFYGSDTQITPAPGTPTEPQLPKFVQEEMTAESFLESKIKIAREELFKYLEMSKQVYIDKSEDYFKTEREVTSTVSSLHDKRELLFPNALYVLTGGLFGSVLARKRNILFKFLFPAACGVISMKIFFPLTFENVFGFLDNAQKKNMPDVYAKQTELINKAEDMVKKTSESADMGSKEISGFFQNAKKSFGDYTGLNVDQTVSEKKK